MKPQAVVLEPEYRGNFYMYAGHWYRFASILMVGDLKRWAYVPE